MQRIVLLSCVALAGLGLSASANAQSEGIAQWLSALQNVEREGEGNQAASQAWNELTASADAYQLPTILAVLDEANPLAANWIHAAVDAIAERHVQSGQPLPTEGLREFLNDRGHNPRARRLAYEWIARVDPTAPDRIIPRMLDDPSLEMRREAVARVIAEAEAAAKQEQASEAIATYRRALAAARDLDQIKQVADALKELGEPVDLAEHFGFLLDWRLVGPFNNVDGVGFDEVYPPEESLDLSATYDGKDGAVKWIASHTDDEYGAVDLNQDIGKHMGAVGYATATFVADEQQPVEIRVGSGNAVKIWLNGQLLAAAEAYHANDVMDQYVGQGTLQKGKNTILVKVCQNEQTEDWAQDWKFQLRVCDALGKAVLSADRPAPRAATARASTE